MNCARSGSGRTRNRIEKWFACHLCSNTPDIHAFMLCRCFHADLARRHWNSENEQEAAWCGKLVCQRLITAANKKNFSIVCNGFVVSFRRSVPERGAPRDHRGVSRARHCHCHCVQSSRNAPCRYCPCIHWCSPMPSDKPTSRHFKSCAAGTAEGNIVVWDFDTKGVAKVYPGHE